MSEIILNAVIKPKSDTKENWESNNPTLKENEIGVEKSYVEDGISFGPRLKIGTGTTAWNSLQYLSVGQSVGPTSSIIGLKNNVTHEYVSLIGDSLKSDNDYQTIVGRANKPITESVNFETGKPLFCVGNGKISDSTNGVTSDADRSNAMYVDEFGNIVASKNVYINGNKNITDPVIYEGTSDLLNPLEPIKYSVGDDQCDVFTIGKNIKVTKNNNEYFIENISTIPDTNIFNNSIIIAESTKSTGNHDSCSVSSNIEVIDSIGNGMIPDSYPMFAITTMGEIYESYGYPIGFSNDTNYVNIENKNINTAVSIILNIPYGCSCKIWEIKISINGSKLYQTIGSSGMMTPEILGNIYDKIDKSSDFEWEDF